MMFTHASEDLLMEHYIDLRERPFYSGLVKYMHPGPGSGNGNGRPKCSQEWQSCWMRPIQKTESLVPSVVISASKLAETLSMAVTWWKVPTERSACGLNLKNWWNTKAGLETGSTSNAIL
ncbi:NDKA kinase, partial [Polypterus senegalus]